MSRGTENPKAAHCPFRRTLTIASLMVHGYRRPKKFRREREIHECKCPAGSLYQTRLSNGGRKCTSMSGFSPVHHRSYLSIKQCLVLFPIFSPRICFLHFLWSLSRLSLFKIFATTSIPYRPHRQDDSKRILHPLFLSGRKAFSTGGTRISGYSYSSPTSGQVERLLASASC